MHSVAMQRVYFISMKGRSVYHVELITTRKFQDSQEIANPVKDSLVAFQAFLYFSKLFT